MTTHPYLNFTDCKYRTGKVVGTSYHDFNGNGLTNKSITVVNIPSAFDDVPIVEIGMHAFMYTSITSVFISKSVLLISWGAFECCSSISHLRFEEGSKLERIGGAAFKGCSRLKRIDLPSSVKQIDSNVWKSFMDINIICFSYLGAINFSNVEMFTSVAVVHVSPSYQFDLLGNVSVKKDNATCNNSYGCFYLTRGLYYYICNTNNFILIHILISR